jgi:hypothetical protein
MFTEEFYMFAKHTAEWCQEKNKKYQKKEETFTAQI